VRWWVGTARFCVQEGCFIPCKMTPFSPHLTPPRLHTGESMHLVSFWPSPASRARQERQRGGIGNALVGRNSPVLCAGGVSYYPAINCPRRCSSTPPLSRNLTQTYFTITSSGSDAVMRASVSHGTMPFHEHLTLQQNEHIYSGSGRVFHHEDTGPPSPLGLQFHEPPD
jgi:hypothetical protein